MPLPLTLVMFSEETCPQKTEQVFLAPETMLFPLCFLAFQQVFPPRPSSSLERPQLVPLRQGADFLQVTESQRASVSCFLSTHLTWLEHQRPVLMGWGVSRRYVAYKKNPNIFLSVLFYETLLYSDDHSRAGMVEWKEVGIRQGVQVSVQPHSSCVILDLVSLTLEFLIIPAIS